MDHLKNRYSRRRMLQLIGGCGALALTGRAFAQDPARTATPWMDLGPFYPVVPSREVPPDELLLGWDIILING